MSSPMPFPPTICCVCFEDIADGEYYQGEAG
jgi:hypothetical protein